LIEHLTTIADIQSNPSKPNSLRTR